jgi:hypothetical protein
MSSSFNRRFSSAKASRSRDVLANDSFKRSTSCSSALMYISFLSRWVLESESVRYMLSGKTLLPLRLTIKLLSPCQSWLAVGLGTSSLCRLAICACMSIVPSVLCRSYKPRVVFFSVKFLKNPNCASAPLDSLPTDCHCPVLSISDAKPAKLPRLLLLMSEKHSDARREAVGEG